MSTVRTKRTYLRNYSPLRYEKDEAPDLFAVASRGGMRMSTFVEPVATPTFRRESRDIVAEMVEHDTVAAKAKLPQKIKKTKRLHAHVTPWFALASGMVVAGAVVMAFAVSAPESSVMHGVVASALQDMLAAATVLAW